MMDPISELSRKPEAATQAAYNCSLCSQPITEDHQTARRWETFPDGQSRIYVIHWACGLAGEADEDE